MSPSRTSARSLAHSIQHLQVSRSDALRRPPRASILILEDDIDLLTVLARMLVADGYFVTASQLAEHATAVLDASRPVDLVIADLMLPDSDGLRFCTETARKRPGMPFIVMTGSDTPIELAQFPPGTDAMYKPLRRAKVLDLISSKLDLPDPDLACAPRFPVPCPTSDADNSPA